MFLDDSPLCLHLYDLNHRAPGLVGGFLFGIWIAEEKARKDEDLCAQPACGAQSGLG